MGNFLRFAALVLLLLIGFGGGICGLFGLGAVAVGSIGGHRQSGGEDFTSLALVLSAAGLIIAALCAWGVRALARGLKRSAQAGAANPPSPPSAPPPAA
jgi:uncharacterized membrane protein